jgi:predicted metal-dependent enzyme (double-stranded beta helix superfamily)
MYYPNIPGEVLLENDKLVVQRFIIEPGQWEGIHRHPPDQLYIHIKGGEWTVKYGDDAETSVSATGEVGWSDTPTEFSAMHESGNTGDEPIDLIWVNLKPGCLAEPAGRVAE